jgi:hypothetical protein
MPGQRTLCVYHLGQTFRKICGVTSLDLIDLQLNIFLHITDAHNGRASFDDKLCKKKPLLRFAEKRHSFESLLFSSANRYARCDLHCLCKALGPLPERHDRGAYYRQGNGFCTVVDMRLWEQPSLIAMPTS